jgi:molecular chaperone GrpE
MKRRSHVEDVADEQPIDAASPEGHEVQALREELQRERDLHLRARADFENYKRRVERDRDVAAREAKRALLLALIELADGFDRALVHVADSPESVAEGLQGLRRALSSLLEAEGVGSFESTGQPFDPRRHEAIATVKGTGGTPGTVVDEAGRGYLWNNELLRAARVRVAE